MQLIDISIEFSKKKLFSNFNLEVLDGSVVLVKGSNGSGKTTLGRLLGGEFFSYSGKYILDDEEINENTEIFKKCAYVKTNAQENFLFATAYEEIAFPLQNLGFKKEEIEKQVLDVAKSFNLSKILHKNLFELSVGEKQLVAVASVVVFCPRVIVLDEALCSVSETTREKLFMIFKTLCKTKKLTLFYISNTEENLDFFDLVVDTRGEGAKPFLLSQFVQEECVLELKNFSVFFEKKNKVLDNINFNLKKGEVACLNGENGTGKSLFLNALAGFSKTGGGYFLNGEQVLNKEQIYEQVSIVFQNAENYLSKKTAFEELCQNADKDKVEALAKSLGIADVLEQKLNLLSTGEKRLVAVGCAILKNPKVLILDEVFASLSNENKLKLFNILTKLCKQGLGIIFVNHSLKENEILANFCFNLPKLLCEPKTSKISLGRYSPGDSVIHNTPASIKIVSAITFMVFALLATKFWHFAVIFSAIFVVIVFSKINLFIYFKYILNLFILSLFLFFLNWLTLGINSALLVLFRLCAINIFVPLLTFTTSPLKLLTAFKFNSKIKWIKSLSSNFSIVTLLAVSSVGESSTFCRNIINWQKSLGLVYEKTNFKKQIKRLADVTSPLFEFLIKLTNLKAQNLITKGYLFVEILNQKENQKENKKENIKENKEKNKN